MTKSGKSLFDKETDSWLEYRRKEIEKIKKMSEQEAEEYIAKYHPNWRR